MGEGAACAVVTILDVLRVDLCARAILGHVPVDDLVRSERVCKRWQRVVHYYLRGCHTFGYIRVVNRFYFPFLELNSQTIIIDLIEDSPSSVCKLLDKWGHYIRKAIIDLGYDTHLDIIAPKCPNLQQIELTCNELEQRVPSLSQVQNLKHLKQIVFNRFSYFSEDKNSDLALATLIQDKYYESITICYNTDITGKFLKSMKPNYLKSLTFDGCLSLRITDLHSAVENLRKLTYLKLEEDITSMLNDVALLLKELPQLEYLYLAYPYNEVPLCKKSFEAFGGLVNLKRLTLRGQNSGVNDAFLEVLARGCTKLEYLEIHESEYTGITGITVRGVAALCRRSPAAVTTLDFSEFKDSSYDLEDIFNKFIRDAPLYQELAGLGCVQLTLEWFRDAVQDPRGRRLELAPTPAVGATHGDFQELKLRIW